MNNKIIRTFNGRVIALLTIMCLFTTFGCSNKAKNEEDAVFVFHHEPSNAVYYWKTVFSPNEYERRFMKDHQVKRIYLKLFDVGVDNLYDGEGEVPVPIATTFFKDSIKHVTGNDIEVVPVVFITVEALRLDKPLSEKIVKRVDDMCRAQHIEYNEIQLDCDWTKETKGLFYKLCRDVKEQLHEKKKGLSSTIRLHQLRDTLPDIDYGVLMLYNTENLQNPNIKNSIINSRVVSEYMRHAKSDKHLDFAYPTYEWTLWFKDNKFMGILTSEDTTLIKGYIRHERSEFHEIMETKRVLKKGLKDIGYPSSIIIYHLDSTNLSKYRNDEIEKIYSR